MPLRQIDAASQRSAPSFSAISDSRIESSSSTTKTIEPVALSDLVAGFMRSAFVRRQREPKGNAMPIIGLGPLAASVSPRDRPADRHLVYDLNEIANRPSGNRNLTGRQGSVWCTRH